MDVIQECENVFLGLQLLMYVGECVVDRQTEEQIHEWVTLLSAVMLPHLVSCAVLVFPLVIGGSATSINFPNMELRRTWSHAPTPSTETIVAWIQQSSREALPTQSVPALVDRAN